MGQTRVDLQHLLENLRDAYRGDVEETILTEIVANALDSGARRITLSCDPGRAALTIVDDGSGMRRQQLARYHDLATSSKTRGAGIGFAGVGIKLALLVSREVVTESRRGTSQAATTWSLAGRQRAPWRWLKASPQLTGARGTAVRLLLENPLSPLLDPRYVESALRNHFEPLLDPRLADVFTRVYGQPINLEVNGQRLAPFAEDFGELEPLAVRLPRQRKPSAVGWIARSALPLADSRRGLAVSTFGKVIKRGWDWLGIAPRDAERISGLVEAPPLAACLTLNKADFLRTGARGSEFAQYRQLLRSAVIRQLEAWGDQADAEDPARRKLTQPVERDLEQVLAGLAAEYPQLSAVVEARAGGDRKLPLTSDAGRGSGDAHREPGSESSVLGQADAASAPAVEAASEPARRRLPAARQVPEASASRKPGRFAISIAYEARVDDPELARLGDRVVLVNNAHPAFRRAAELKSDRYHLALSVAFALASETVEEAQYRPFINDFLKRWGVARPARSRRSADDRSGSLEL